MAHRKLFSCNLSTLKSSCLQVGMEGMEVDDQLASLVDTSLKIHDRKRRLSGRFRGVNIPRSENVINDEDIDLSDESNLQSLRRSARKKIRPLNTEKRRVFTKPKKISNGNNLTEVESLYLDKKVKRLPPTLETIFEEPQEKKNDIVLMSNRKFKRCIEFSDICSISKLKIKKRSMKIKKLTARGRIMNKKVTMDFLMEKLQSLSDNEEEDLA